MIVGGFLDRGAPGPWDLADPSDLLTVLLAVGLAVDATLATATSRNVRVTAAVLAPLLLAGVLVPTAEVVARGLPGPSTGVVAVGATLTALATVAPAFERPTPPAGVPSRRRRALGAGTGIVVAGLLAVAGAVGVPEMPVRSTTTDPGPVASPLAAPPTTVRWRRPLPPGAEVRDVQASASGVVVADDEGAVTALDGATGAVRWRFAREGAEVSEVRVSPDRRTVAVRHEAGSAAVVTVLDALSGARRGQVATLTSRLALTDRVLAVGTRADGDDAGQVIGWSTDTVAPRWTWTPAPGCELDIQWVPASPGTAPTAMTCPDRVELQGLDEDTGRPRWTRTRVAATRPEARAPLDGAVVLWGELSSPDEVVTPADGTERPLPPTPLSAVYGNGPVLWLAGDDAVAGVRAWLDPAGPALVPTAGRCGPGESEQEAAVLRAPAVAATLRACATAAGDLTLHVDDRAPIPLGLVAAEPSITSLDGTLGNRPVLVVPTAGGVVVGAVGDRTVVGLG